MLDFAPADVVEVRRRLQPLAVYVPSRHA